MMKSWSISQRLLSLIAALLAVLAIGAVVFLRADHQEAQALERRSRFEGVATRLRLDMLQMSDAMRGQLLEPTNTVERERKAASDADLARTLEENSRLVVDRPDLAQMLQAVADFDERKLNPLEEQFTALVGRDAAAAATLYNATYLPLRKEQDRLIDRFVASALNDMAVAVQRAQAERTAAAWVMGGIFVLALVGGFYFARSLARPIEGLTRASAGIATGDLTLALPEREDTDEIGQLTRSFSQLVGTLREFSAAAKRVAAGDLTVEFKPQSDRDVMGNALADMARNLAALIGQVQKSGIQVNTSATEIAATAKQQQATASEIAATTTEIGATSNEISATSKELVKTIGEVARTAEETAHIAGEGRNGLARMETTMTQVTDAVGTITAKLAVLNEKAGNISTVVTTIVQVADQTNLLSLNAAIEAEKAGEFGRGFAVVAREIRRLADQTAVASSDIGEMVKEMQSAVSAGVMGMDKFSEEVRRAVQEVRTAGTQLAQIIEQVQALTPRIERVNEGMQAQATGASQISEALAQLSEGARQTADSLRQSNEAIQQLNEATFGLRAGIERFTVAR
jgi:methyl-accepting chemotaxis protein WspA